MNEGMGIPWMPSAPPVRLYQRKAIAQIKEPNEIWSIPKYSRVSLTQKAPMTSPTNAAMMGPTTKPTHMGNEVLVSTRATV